MASVICLLSVTNNNNNNNNNMNNTDKHVLREPLSAAVQTSSVKSAAISVEDAAMFNNIGEK